jgi:anthranilate 1,2-dioxygenase small subunit
LESEVHVKEATADADVTLLIERLLSDYSACIDDERYEQWPDFFTERCVYRITSRDNHRKKMPFGFLFCDSRGMLSDRIASMKNANIFEPHTYRHLLGRSAAKPAADGSWAVETSFLVVRTMHDGAQEVFSTGVYIDRIVESGDSLLFKERIVVCDSARIDALLVIPL